MSDELNKVDTQGQSASPRKALRITKSILSWTSIVLLTLLVIIAVWMLIDKLILKSKVPSFMGYSSLIVATGSMSGTIEEGDVIIIKDTGDYKIGDIITFIQGDEKIPTTHRIIGYAEGGGYVTRGDANNSDDRRAVKDDEIFGEVVTVMHGLGVLIGWLGKGGGYIYLLGFIVIIGLGIFLIKDEKLIFVGDGKDAQESETDQEKKDNEQENGEEK